MRWRITIAAMCLIAVTGSVALAQSVSFAIAGGDATHNLQPNSTGFAASLAFPIRGRLELVLTLDRLRGDATGAGFVCAGLINPEACPIEPYTQKGRLMTLGVGPDVPLYRARYVGLSLRPQLLLGRIESETLGHETGNTLSATKTELGVSLGAEIRLTPLRRFPFDFTMGAAYRNLGPAKKDDAVEAYTPFETSFTARTIYAGLAFTRRRDPSSMSQE
jgi:hypothetical protein